MTVKNIGAIILFTAKLPEMLLFYRSLGLPLSEEQHTGGPGHFSCEFGAASHFAIYEGSTGESSVARAGGSGIIAFEVEGLDEIHKKLLRLGAIIDRGPEERPWGIRLLVLDPDGRLVEIFENRQVH